MQKKIVSLAVLAALGGMSTAVLADDAAPAAAPAAAAPAPVVLNGPGMNFPLVGSANPLSFDAGPIGKVYVSGAVSALAFGQNHATAAVAGTDFFHDSSTLDFSNAQIMLQKVDGPVQFFIQGGGYSIPIVGTPYIKASKATGDTYGVIPTAYIKIAPNDTFSIQAGKLPTLFGAEYTYTFENANIERGLLWNQENVFTRGVQANYTKGPLAISASVTDGFYSKDYKWGTALVSYTINDSNSISVVAGGNFDKSSATNTYTIPTPQNNGQIYNLIYKYAKGPLTLQPYLQYTYVPSEASLGWTKDAKTYGAALIANYAVNDTINIGARAEWIGSSGSPNDGSPNSGSTGLLGYGTGSDAWSLTVTPTYQKGGFFVRGEASYVKINSLVAGDGFSSTGNEDSQARLMLETGFLF